MIELVDERRRTHQRVGFEREDRDRQPRGRAAAAGRRTPRARPPGDRTRPASQARAGSTRNRRCCVAAAPATRRRPARRDATCVEVAESRAPRIDEVDAGIAGARRKRLPLDPAANQRRDDVAVHGRGVEARPRVAQGDERAEDRAARAEMPGAQRSSPWHRRASCSRRAARVGRVRCWTRQACATLVGREKRQADARDARTPAPATEVAAARASRRAARRRLGARAPAGRAPAPAARHDVEEPIERLASPR